MKKFTKITLILAGVFTFVGIVCVMVSAALGLTWKGFANMVEEGRFNFSFGNQIIVSGQREETTQDIEGVRNLEIEFGAGKLEISYTDVEKIQVKQEGVNKFECYVDDGTLHIEGNNNLLGNKSGGKIIIQIPKDTVFDEVEMEIGAGQATVKDLVANSVNIDVGAGEARLTGLDAKELEAHTGAGSIYAELVDSETDYSYDAECGVGQIVIGNTSIGGLGNSKSVENAGAGKYMELDCGVGQIEVKFQN